MRPSRQDEVIRQDELIRSTRKGVYVSRTLIFFGGVATALVLIGLFFGNGFFNSAKKEILPSRAENDSVSLREENRRLKEEVLRLKSAAGSKAEVTTSAAPTKIEEVDPSLAQLQRLADLQKRKLLDASVTAIGRNGMLTAQFAELFGLSPDQQAALQHDLDKARERMVELRLDSAKTSRAENGNLVIALGSLSESPQIYDEVMDAFARNLGPERNAAFMALGERPVTEYFENFGAADEKLTLSRGTDPKDPTRSTYYLREERHMPNSNSANSRSYRDLNALQQRLGAMAKLLPPDLK